LKATSAPEIGLLLAGGMCLLPFLLPYHQQPVLSFYPEWLAVALGVVAAFAVLVRGGFRTQTVLPLPALWLAAFTLYLALRWAIGEQAYPASALLAVLYALYAVLMVQLGAQLAAGFGVERVAVVLAVFVLAGALANAAAGMIQFYGRPALFEDIVAELHGRRAYGNIAQSNLYTNYLALGQAALVFLWLRDRLRMSYAIAALVLLVVASALSGARGALLYAIWFAATGMLTAGFVGQPDASRLRWGALGAAIALVAAHLLVPWINGALQLGLAGEGTLERLQLTEPRPAVFLLALRIFADAPFFGVGMGEFSGAAFARGLDPSLTAIGEIWTSPHNLPLHLLAETGALGTVLALGALGLWGASLLWRYRAQASPALWWLVAAAGVELLHALIEYPLWSAHFLGLSALLIGASASLRTRGPLTAVAVRIAGICACAVLSVALALVLRDYLRLDLARAAGTRATLAPPAQVQRDTETMNALRAGLLGPVAELWIFSGAPLEPGALADRLAMGERVMSRWPANEIVVRHVVFLGLDGQTERAGRLLAEALRAFPHRRAATLRLLERAAAAEPEKIAPLLAIAEHAGAGAREQPR
jgi:O-antigen ligase